MAQPTKSKNKPAAKPAAKTPAKPAVKPAVKAAAKVAAKSAAKAPAVKAAPAATQHSIPNTQHSTRNTQHHTPGLHYNKEELLADYARTYSAFMVALAIGIVGALIYFFAMIVYLGAKGHTPGDDYVRAFGSRIQYEYKGLRLPQYDDPSLLNNPTDKAAH